MDPLPSSVEVAFAQHFAAWGLALPGLAVRELADGWLLGKGWSVRWRWRPDGTLEFLASHRMTNQRWLTIAVDGTLGSKEVPAEGMFFPKDATDEQRAAVQREHRAAWSAHGRAVAEAGMEPIQTRGPVPSELTGPGLMTWRLEDGPWQASPLRAPPPA